MTRVETQLRKRPPQPLISCKSIGHLLILQATSTIKHTLPQPISYIIRNFHLILSSDHPKTRWLFSLPLPISSGPYKSFHQRDIHLRLKISVFPEHPATSAWRFSFATSFNYSCRLILAGSAILKFFTSNGAFLSENDHVTFDMRYFGTIFHTNSCYIVRTKDFAEWCTIYDWTEVTKVY